MRSMRDRARKTLLSFLARFRGEVRALQDLRQITEVLRLSSVFTVTMLLPIAFLAILSMSSIRSQELAVDDELRTRAQAITAQLYQDLEHVFTNFETSVELRIRRGESPTAALGELSPYLRAAFRFDDDGALVGPFEMQPRDLGPSRQAPVGWQRAAAAARAIEEAEPLAAAVAWRRTREHTLDPSTLGESILGEARSLARARRYEDADKLLGHLFSEHATERDLRGFRFPDLAILEIARLRLERASGMDVENATTALTDYVEGMLTQSSPWTVGRVGEPAVVREALRLLEGHANPDWLARSRSRLNELQAELDWAELVADEIEIVYIRISDGEFRYIGARTDSPALWVLMRAQYDTYAFSFSALDLYEALQVSVAQRNAGDPELLVGLSIERNPPEGALSIRGLGPWLPGATLTVVPRDAEALDAAKRRGRIIRLSIVISAVCVAFFGALWIARIIAWEVETARQRADFAANVSHELRSPITQIRLKGEALQLGLVEPGEDMQQHFDAIVRESERLSRLVDNVLDFAAIERGAKRYQLRPDDLGGAVFASVEAARSALEAAGMEIELDVEEDLPPIAIDREAIGQVMTNLLSNALKYGAEGKWVRVRLHLVEDRVVLSVADRGIGIGTDELHRVFDDFFRSVDPAVRRTKGTGIGLAIVRYIVEAHGGTISVDSAVGRGARFIIQLPVGEDLHASDPVR